MTIKQKSITDSFQIPILLGVATALKKRNVANEASRPLCSALKLHARVCIKVGCAGMGSSLG